MFNFKKKAYQNIFFLFLLFLLIFPAVFSLLKSGFFSSHDGEWMVIRFTDFHRSLADGQFPVRLAGRLNFGFGYPIFNFLYPLPFYLAEIFYLLGLSFVNSIKAVFIISFFASGLFMYWWIAPKWGKLAGLVSAVFYVWTPYRFLDVYVRGSLGEATAFIFPPLIFLSLEKLKREKSNFFLFLGSLAYAGLITSHNTMAMLFSGIIAFYLAMLWLVKKEKSVIWPLLPVVLLGLSLSAFFWLPALWDKQYTVFSKTLISCFFCHFPTLKQLLFPSWGFSPSLPLTDKETISFQIGMWNLLVVLIVMVFLLFKTIFQQKKLWDKKNYQPLYFLIIFIGASFLMLKPSALFWKIALVYNFVQFPWRLLALTTFSSSALAGFLIFCLKGKKKIISALILTIGIVIASFSYARPESFISHPEGFYTTNDHSTTVAAEYTPIWVKKLAEKRPSNKIEVLKGQTEIKDLKIKSNKITFKTTNKNPVLLKVNLHYFPGWQVWVNNKKEKVNFQDDGLIKFFLSPGKNKIKIEFKETFLRQAANFISLGSLLAIIWLMLKSKCRAKS